MINPVIMGKSAALRAGAELNYSRYAIKSGVLGLMSPIALANSGLAIARWGLIGGAVGVAAARWGDKTAVVDERGELTFSDLHNRSNALANAWLARGLQPGEGVAILARNHRGFLDALLAAAKCGARIILLNTDFAGPQIRDVATREGTDLLVYDDEYAEMLDGVTPPRGAFRAWTEDPGQDSIEALMASAPSSAPPRPGVHARIILLTSGTTGTPKGAPRPDPMSLAPIGGITSRVPFTTNGTIELCAPMFHTLGFAHALLAIGMGSTMVLRRRFSPQATLESIQRNRSTGMIVAPVMLSRMLEHGVSRYDVSSLRIIFVAGAQLGADLCKRAMDAFGPVLYNMYGSTEVAYATVATPDDLSAEPGCVGKPVAGSVVKVYDDDDKPAPAGMTGRIFVGNTVQFEGYTGGGTKASVDGLMATGDVGHFDSGGRLFIDGRDDDMIVSGGENVFPGEVEELLASHPSVVEASVLGVPDEKYGARLKAFVVTRETLDEDTVKQYVKQNLARYKVPREVAFVDELPRNPSGKVLKRVLREM
nr:acyl-CoA synthetase [Lolliginicoccus levis]